MPDPSAMLPTLIALADERGPTFWMPRQSSTVAPDVDFLFMTITWICYFFFALILVLMVYFMFRYRRTPDHRGGGNDGPTHNTPLELTWTIIPLLLVIGIFYFGFRGFIKLSTSPRNAYEINVTAQQWSWSFQYPNGAISTTELYVPAEEPVRLILRSNDVIHSLYIPDFRVKRDVVPGRYTEMWFEAPHPTFEDDFHWLFCTEYCGTGHSNMNVKVHVLPKADFAEKVTDLAQWIDKVPDDELYFKAGPAVYAACAQCHSLDGTPGTGPTWKGLIDRLREGTGTFADGKTYADVIGPGKEFATPEDYIRDSILNPSRHIVQGYGNAMPTFRGQLNERKIQAIIGMMKHLDEFDAKGKYLGGGGDAPATQ